MLKRLAKEFARAIAPMVIQELIIILESIIKTDLNQDGKIGKQ